MAGAKFALERYLKRQLRGNKRAKREKNESPEKAVEKEVVRWLASAGFCVSVVESKAVYSPSAGRYLRGQTEPGFTDICGVTPTGIGCFIELKAPGRKSTIRPAQVDFIQRKIKKNAFACCVDSFTDLADVYRTWSMLLKESDVRAQEFLISRLPKSKLNKIEDVDPSSEIPW